MLIQTPSQTVGPFFHDALVSGAENVLVNEHTVGQRIYLVGQVWDGDGQPVPDALLEIWQADAGGFFRHPADGNRHKADENFHGFGRADTTDRGRYTFTTIKPGCVPGRAGQPQAPHVNIRLFVRGLLLHLYTRLYFADEPLNEADPVLSSLDPERRQTLLAHREDSGDQPTYRFDIHLQGEKETVFFEP